MDENVFLLLFKSSVHTILFIQGQDYVISKIDIKIQHYQKSTLDFSQYVAHTSILTSWNSKFVFYQFWIIKPCNTDFVFLFFHYSVNQTPCAFGRLNQGSDPNMTALSFMGDADELILE